MRRTTSRSQSRRQFLGRSAGVALAAFAAPAIVTASKTDSEIIVGEGDHKFEVIHNWPQLPSKYTWQTTHNVALDKDGFLYVIHEGRADQPDHPSIFVFDPDGKFVRAFGKQYQGGGHGIEVKEEDGKQYLYICAYQQVKAFAKLDLNGEEVWTKHAPMKAKNADNKDIYAPEEDTKPELKWGADRFLPTNITFLPDGDFFLADGYGSFYIHRFDKEGNWKSCFGGPGEGEGKFNTPHGIWYDDRPGREPSLAICDRAHHTLQYMTLDGKYIETLTGYGLPANLDTWKEFLLVPELFARVSILDGKNNVVARLGADVERITAKDGGAIRGDESKWIPGKFVHPHDACFDPNGNIYVAEWVASGRVSKLRRVT
jgi:hypothetical protein